MPPSGKCCQLIVCVLNYVIKIMNDIRLLVLGCYCVIDPVFNICNCKRAVSLRCAKIESQSEKELQNYFPLVAVLLLGDSSSHFV